MATKRRCPRCGSLRVEPSLSTLGSIAEGVGMVAGGIIGSLFGNHGTHMGAHAGEKIAGSMVDNYICKHCGHRFHYDGE